MNRFFILVTALLVINYFPAFSQTDTLKEKINDQAATGFETYTQANAGEDTAIERKLIDLAMKGPTFSATMHRGKINELQLKLAKTSWLNLLTISTNYNDQSFAKNNPQATVVYPKYYFGITIPLGIIFSQPTTVKAAREVVLLSKDQQLEQARNIKADILSKYKQYKLYDNLLEMQSTLINDVLANAAQAEDNFKKGVITVENYIGTQKTTNEELAKNMNLKLQQELLKLEIERIIGVPLEDVLKPTVKD